MQRRPSRLVLTVFAYTIATLAVQGTSHFAINANHYAAISIMRVEPIIALGVASMVIQGFILAWLYPIYAAGGSTFGKSIAFSWILGAFLASYIVLAEPGKYAVPSLASWLAVEATVAFVQYTLFGICLGLIHRGPDRLP